jgi:hypothetical protein
MDDYFDFAQIAKEETLNKMNDQWLDSYGFLKTWAGYTFLNTDKAKIAEARERWYKSME